MCVQISSRMEDFSGKKLSTSEQHQEMGSSRQKQDAEDSHKLITFFEKHNPFTGTSDKDFHNIVSGVVANHSVNVDDAGKCGDAILTTMNSKMVSE